MHLFFFFQRVSADTKNTNSLPKTVTEASSLGAAVSTAVYENVYKDVIKGFVADKRRELYNNEWSRAEIVIRTTNWRELSASQKQGVILHEIGHALKLDHTALYVLSVMISGEDEPCLCDYITVFDMYSLIKKWGI